MGALLQKLLDELSDARQHDHRVCEHGGVLYPMHWNQKTQTKAVASGALKVCSACQPRASYAGWRYLIVRTV